MVFGFRVLGAKGLGPGLDDCLSLLNKLPTPIYIFYYIRNSRTHSTFSMKKYSV